MRKIAIIFLFLITAQVLGAQEKPFYTNYSWDTNPAYKVDPATSEELLELKSKVVTEFIYDKGGDLVEYFLEHRVLWLNSDNAIERYNKIYLPYSGNSELKISRARVITKEGKVLELDKSDIFTASDEETGRQYKYFAFQGIEKGSFIEYYYVEKRNPRYNGNRISLQSSIEKYDIEFDLFSPKNLVFAFKSYNGLPQMEKDTTLLKKQHWKVKVDHLSKLEEEELSAYNASRAAVIYKLDQNLATNARDISSYGQISQNLYSFYYPEHSKRTSKKVEQLISRAVGNKPMEEETQIRKLEFYIKNNVYYTEASSPELSDLEEVLQNKVASEAGLVKLYTAALTSLGIKHELVLTSDRQEIKFDKDFEATNFLTDFLIYFPKSKAYLSPVEIDSRFGFPPAYLTDNYGLFVEKITIGGLTSAIGKIKYIEPVSADKTFDEMVIDVAFDKDDPSRINVSLDRGMNGYYAMYVHPFMHLVKEDSKKELIESFATNLDEGAEILESEVINADPELFGLKPLRFVLNFNSDAFMEKAGNKYIFKVGELIGRQIELYQEKERVLPLEAEFQRSYFRTIKIKLPKGYAVVNPEDINIQNTFIRDEKEVLSFNSLYEIKDGSLIITADEHYRVNQVSTEKYQEYRTVINSAADFNKISLILEPIVN